MSLKQYFWDMLGIVNANFNTHEYAQCISPSEATTSPPDTTSKVDHIYMDLTSVMTLLSTLLARIAHTLSRSTVNLCLLMIRQC